MTGLRRCDSCGVVMGSSGDACPICSTPYESPTGDRVVGPSGIDSTAIDTSPTDASAVERTDPADPTDGREAAFARGMPAADGEPASAERTLVGAGAPTSASGPIPTAGAVPTAVEPQAPALIQRPDPYAQINNPLHTTWGEPIAPPPTKPVLTAPPTRVRRRSPWLRRGAFLVVLAILAGAAWLQRDRITDAIDDLRDRSDEGDAAAAPSVAPDPTRSYLDWEQANESSIVPLMKEWNTRASALDATGDDVEAGLGEIAGARDAVQELAILVDSAPASQIRSDILSLLLNFMAACDDLARLSDTGDEAYYDAAIDKLDAMDADEQRFADTYGTESIFLG